MSTDFVYDTGSVPESKTNKKALPSGALSSQYWRAADANLISDDLTSLRAAILNGKYWTLQDMSDDMPAVSGAGQVRLANDGGVLKISENGAAYSSILSRITGAISVAAFGSSPDAKGATYSSGVIALQPADATHPGAVSAAAQTFGGVKTFASRVLVGGGSDDLASSLQVTGGSALNGFLAVSGTPVTDGASNCLALFSNTSDAASGAPKASIEFAALGPSNLNTGYSSVNGGKEDTNTGRNAGTLTFATRINSGAITEGARLTSSQNFLIGATSDHSGERLQVTGTGYFSGALNAASLTLGTALPIAQGGTGATSASAAFAALVQAPTSSVFGGVKALAATSNNFLTSIGTDGIPVAAQPSFSNLSGSIAASQLIAPTSSTFGGVKSLAAVSHNFLTSIGTDGIPVAAQPAPSDLTGWPSNSSGVLTNNGSGTLSWASASSGITALTGDVTASGSGSVATTVALVGGSSASNVHAAELLANAAASANTASAIVKRDSASNAVLNNITRTVTSTATAGSTTTLTASSSYRQIFTGTSAQTIVLPDATTLTAGHCFLIVNRSTASLTVNKNGGTLVFIMAPLDSVLFTVTAVGTAAGTWDGSSQWDGTYNTGTLLIGPGTNVSGAAFQANGVSNADGIVLYNGYMCNTVTAYTSSPTSGIAFGVRINAGGAINTLGSIQFAKENATTDNNLSTCSLIVRGSGGTYARGLYIDSSARVMLGSTTNHSGETLQVTGAGYVSTTLTAGGAIAGSNLSGTNTGDITLGAIGASANANGASLSSQVLTLQPASASFGGVVTTGTQTIAGDKTFSGATALAGLTNSGNCKETARTQVADADQVVTTAMHYVCYTSIAAARAVTLPTATLGLEIVVLDESGSCGLTNTITIATVSGGSVVLNAAYAYARFWSNGTAWFRVG